MTHIEPYKVYRAVRGIDGHVRVTANGQPLPHVVLHSPTGFEWGYGGSGPADLALSILADFFDERPSHEQLYGGECQCQAQHQAFKWALIADAPHEGFEIHASKVGFFIRMDAPGRGFQLETPDSLEKLPMDYTENIHNNHG
jgi:hypothetical protein